MLYSGFNTVVASTPVKFLQPNYEVDQFTSSEFFKDVSGHELKDYTVALTSSPEVREKMAEYLVERDVKGFDDNISDEEVLQSIKSKYDSSTSRILSLIDQRIADLRENK